MKRYFFLSVLFSLLGSFSAFSQETLSSTQSLKQKYYGGAWHPLKGRGTLDCYTLLNKDWGYPTGQAYAFCNEAEISCLRHELIKNKIKNVRGRLSAALQEERALAEKDVELKVGGCQLAIEDGTAGTSVLQNQRLAAPMKPLKN